MQSDIPSLTATNADPVRESTDPGVRRDINEKTLQRVERCAAQGREAIARRLRELDQESDVEGCLEVNASAPALSGVALGASVDRRWLAVPGVVLAFSLQHGVQGWCPPVPLFRRLGVRTPREIDAERYALKALRGDFEQLDGEGAELSAQKAFAAVRT